MSPTAACSKSWKPSINGSAESIPVPAVAGCCVRYEWINAQAPKAPPNSASMRPLTRNSDTGLPRAPPGKGQRRRREKIRAALKDLTAKPGKDEKEAVDAM